MMTESGLKSVAAIVGAGKTGRGFIARFAAEAAYQIVFIDESESLVKRLQEDHAYTIHFFGGTRPSIRISGAIAAQMGSSEAEEWLARASVVFTTVGEHNLPRTAPYLYGAFVKRRALQLGMPYDVITCENGVTPGLVLLEAIQKCAAESGDDIVPKLRISEAIVFCSTIEKPGTRLDIESEDYDELPYNGGPIAGFCKLPGMVEVPRFKQLLKRKIYTYNCISACIAYLGAYKGFELYADAANDPDIGEVLEQIVGPLNQAICRRFEVDPAEQRRFSDSALVKFKNVNIRDDIARNARNVMRKLNPNDRMVAPAHLIREAGGPLSALALVMAAALCYRGPEEAALQTLLETGGAETTFTAITGLTSEDALTKSVMRHFEFLQQVKDRTRVRFRTIIEKEMA